jgi:hypothetical protein
MVLKRTPVWFMRNEAAFLLQRAGGDGFDCGLYMQVGSALFYMEIACKTATNTSSQSEAAALFSAFCASTCVLLYGDGKLTCCKRKKQHFLFLFLWFPCSRNVQTTC